MWPGILNADSTWQPIQPNEICSSIFLCCKKLAMLCIRRRKSKILRVTEQFQTVVLCFCEPILCALKKSAIHMWIGDKGKTSFFSVFGMLGKLAAENKQSPEPKIKTLSPTSSDSHFSLWRNSTTTSTLFYCKIEGIFLFIWPGWSADWLPTWIYTKCHRCSVVFIQVWLSQLTKKVAFG